MYKYLAFISYKREDEKWAKWLQNILEHYKLPISVRKADSSRSAMKHNDLILIMNMKLRQFR